MQNGKKNSTINGRSVYEVVDDNDDNNNILIPV
jgi:hypothetical protein